MISIEVVELRFVCVCACVRVYVCVCVLYLFKISEWETFKDAIMLIGKCP